MDKKRVCKRGIIVLLIMLNVFLIFSTTSNALLSTNKITYTLGEQVTISTDVGMGPFDIQIEVKGDLIKYLGQEQTPILFTPLQTGEHTITKTNGTFTETYTFFVTSSNEKTNTDPVGGPISIDKQLFFMGDIVQITLDPALTQIAIKHGGQYFRYLGNEESIIFTPKEPGRYTIEGILDKQIIQVRFYVYGDGSDENIKLPTPLNTTALTAPETTFKAYPALKRDLSLIKKKAVGRQYFGLDEPVKLTFALTEAVSPNIHAANIKKIDGSRIEVDQVQFKGRIGSPTGLISNFTIHINESTNELEVTFSPTNAIQPGEYSFELITNNGPDEITIIEEEFHWGLVSLNTKRSIYKPGDIAEFEIVVLDGNGQGVCDTEILLNVTSPSNTITEMSTFAGDILAKGTCGLYGARFPTIEEGEHLINLVAIMEDNDGINLYFETSFLVQQEYPYDILRETASMIDPTISNNFPVDIYITSYEPGVNELLVKEYVPNSFRIFNTSATITQEENQQVLTWQFRENRTHLHYNYAVPLIWPYLYQLGPMDVNNFSEVRPWFVAVDPNFSVDDDAANDISVAAVNKTSFVVAWHDAQENDVSFRVYYTNGTDISGVIDVDTNANDNSRVDIEAINSTILLIGWIDGSSQDVNYSLHNLDGTLSQGSGVVGAETALGSPAYDVAVAPHDSYFQLCYVDDTEADADIRIIDYDTLGAGSENQIDGNIAPDNALRNLLDCDSLNATATITIRHDDGPADVTFRIMTNLTQVTNTDADQNVGDAGDAAISVAEQNRYVGVWHDIDDAQGDGNDIQIEIRDAANALVLGDLSVDTDASGISRVAAATVQNRSETEESFLVAWNDQNSGDIRAAVYANSGVLRAGPYQLVDDENTTSLLFDVYSRGSLTGINLCNGTFILGYTNTSGDVAVKTFNIDGTEWDGSCDFDNPEWSTELESPTDPATYQLGQNYTFNITWTDPTTFIKNVFIEHNFTTGDSSYANNTVNESNGDEYYYTFSDLAVGTYNWLMIANDSANNQNQTDTFDYTISRASSEVNLSLNVTDGNLSVEVLDTVNITGVILTGEGVITVYLDNVLINNGTEPVINFTDFNDTGVFNVTLVHEQTENYTSSFETHWVEVNDSIVPLWDGQNQSVNLTGQGQIVSLYANLSDNYALAYVWLGTNESGEWVNYTTRRAGFTLQDFTDNTSIYVDEISAAASLIDVEGEGFVRQGVNISYDYDSGVADDTLDVIVNLSATNFSHFQNISYYVKADVASRHRTSIILLNESTSCDVTSPVTMSSASFALITFNVADITGNCNTGEIDQMRIRFSDDSDSTTGTGNITLDELYLTNDTLRSAVTNFTWENETIAEGAVTWIIFFNDTRGNENQTGAMTFEIRDTVAPEWSNNTTSPEPPATYQLGQNYTFNVTWTDDIALDTILIQQNFSTGAALENITVNETDGDVYFYTFSDLTPGVYTWLMAANDTSDNLNQTDTYLYTILQNTSLVNLSLNSVDGNITVEANSLVNLSGTLLLGEAAMILYNNDSIINGGLGPIENLTLFNVTGTFNITLEHPDSENYSFSVETHWIDVNDTLFPNISLQSPPDNNRSTSSTVTFNATINDSLEVANVSLYGDWQGTFERNDTNSSGLNLIDYLFVKPIPDGIHTWGIQACDTSNNCNFSVNRTLTVDAHSPEWEDRNQSNNVTGQGDIIALFTNYSDNLSLQSVWLGTNESGEWVNYSARRAGLTLQDFTDHGSTYIDEISAAASITDVVGEGFVRDAINLSYDYDSGAADDTFDVIVNLSTTNFTHFQNISYYVKADVANRHRTSIILLNESTACTATSPVTMSSTSLALITFNVADISGNCNQGAIDQMRIRFSDDVDTTTGTGNITLDELYLTNDTLNRVFINFTWRNASVTGGSVTWKIYMNDSLGNENSTDDLTFFVQDIIAPQWSNNETDPDSPTTYDLNKNYTFNVTWTDNVALDAIILQHNLTGDGSYTNVTVNASTGDTYYYVFSNLVPGTYSWMMIANDTSNNINQTDLYNYTINRNQSIINLSLNSTNDNLHKEVNSIVNLTGDRLIGEGDITLYRDGAIINQGDTPLVNLTLFNDTGSFNITLVYETTQNFSSSTVTYFVNINDTIFPNITLRAPSDDFDSPFSTVTFNVTIDDNYLISNVSLYTNFTEDFEINTTNFSALKNIDYLFNITNIANGRHIWAIHACDTSNNCNISVNRTFLVDTIVPLINYTFGTPEPNATITTSSLIVNVTVVEDYEESITFRLYNETALLNETTYFVPLRRLNFSNLNDTIYFYNVTVVDQVGRENTTITRNVTVNVQPPQSFNVTESPTDPATYSPGRLYYFNVTWVDILGVQTVLIQHNFTTGGDLANFTVNVSSGNEYSYTFSDLRAGTFSWNMIANDSSNNLNQTTMVTYTIDKNQSTVNLSLDSTDGNITIEVNSVANLSGTRLTGEGDITLLNDDVVVNGGSSPLENLTTFPETGTFNITVRHDETQNYSKGVETHYIDVNDTIFPNITINTPINEFNSSTGNVTFNATIDDNHNISNVSLWANFTGTFEINTTNFSELKAQDYLFNISNIDDGGYIWAIQACDISNNCNITTNRNLTVDKTPPNITESEANITIAITNEFARINCTATDNLIGLDTFIIEADKPTLPHENYTTTNLIGNTWYADVQLDEVGTWTFSCYVNDTLNNLGNRHSDNITVSEPFNAPSIPNLTAPEDGVNLSILGDFNWTNSTDPDEDVLLYILEIDNDSDFSSPEYYNASILETEQPTGDDTVTLTDDGTYYWHVRATDGGLNSSFTAARSFNYDREAPTINLTNPLNNSNQTSGTLQFNFTAIDNLNITLECNLTLDGIINISNINATNNGTTTFTIQGVNDGNHTWNVTCRDVINTNVSTTFNFSVFTVQHPAETNASVDPTDNSSIIVQWSSATSADTYNIYITDNYSAGFPDNPNYTGIGGTSFTDDNASGFARRFYRVSGVNGPAENRSNVTVGKIDRNDLISGFNLLSFAFNVTPLALNNGTNGGYDIPSTPIHCIQSLFRFNGSRFEEITNDLGAWTPAVGSEDFTALENEKSYWMETNSSCNVTMVGSVPDVNITIQFNNSFTVAAWHSVFDPELGNETDVGNPLDVNPTDAIENIFRYNTSGGIGEFQGVHHFVGYGWWPFFGDEDFTHMESSKGYYYHVFNPPANLTHNPNFQT